MIDLRNIAIVGLAVCAALAWGGALVERSKRLEAVAELAAYRADAAEAARHAEAAQREEEARREDEIKKVVTDARLQTHRAQRDAAGARAAGVSLRQQLAAARARGCPTTVNPPAAEGGPPADPTFDLLADVQRRLDEAADGIAAHADRAIAAGRACERAYDALTP